jgi:hypothetical protein
VNKQNAKRKIEALLRRFVAASSQSAYSSVIPAAITAGKLYEAHVLSRVIEELATHESYAIRLINSTFLPLKSAPGPINRSYAYFELRRSGSLRAEIWTDVEFISLSCGVRGQAGSPSPGDYHELDIIVSDKGLSGRPLYDQIWLGVECKNTATYTKNLLKEILGIRRELSFVRPPIPTRFANWPRSAVPAEPPSCLMVYTTDSSVSSYAGPGETFGIDFVYEPI